MRPALALAAYTALTLNACNLRVQVGDSPGLLLSTDDLVDDAAECVEWCREYCESIDCNGSVLLLGQSMGGGVAAELAATRYPDLPCVNERSFSSLSQVPTLLSLPAPLSDLHSRTSSFASLSQRDHYFSPPPHLLLTSSSPPPLYLLVTSSSPPSHSLLTPSSPPPSCLSSQVSASTIGLGGSSAMLGLVRWCLGLAFSRTPWRPPLETRAHWQRLPAGKKMLIYHTNDRVIGAAAALHTALERSGSLEGTAVIRLRGSPRDAHNEDPSDFSPHEWAQAVQWMRGALGLDDDDDPVDRRLRSRSDSRPVRG